MERRINVEEAEGRGEIKWRRERVGRGEIKGRKDRREMRENVEERQKGEER